MSPWAAPAACPQVAPLPQVAPWQEGCPPGPHPTVITGARAQLATAPPPNRLSFVHSEMLDEILFEQLNELIACMAGHDDNCHCKICKRYDRIQVILLEVFD